MKVPKSSSSSSNNTQKDMRHAEIHAKGVSVVGRVNSEVSSDKRVTLNSNNDIVSPTGRVLMSSGEIARYNEKGLCNMVLMKLHPVNEHQFDAPKAKETEGIPRTPSYPAGNRTPESGGFFDTLARLWCGL